MRTLIGSAALHQQLPNIRTPKDTDYFITEPENTPKINNVETFYHPNLQKWNWGPVANLQELYTIKISHIFWDLKNNSWNKHFFDILTLENNKIELIPELYNILYPIWEERYGKKKVNLNQLPEDFFNNNVERKYEHDSIHNSVAYYNEPLFNKILKDNHAIAVDKNKFDNLTHEEKIQLVREEIYATALERQIIPSNYKSNPIEAYNWALKKTLTSFTKGWFPLYMIQNALELRKPEINYVQKHLNNKDKLIPLK